MKKLFIIILTLLYAQFSAAQIPSDCSVAYPLSLHYERDVNHLTIKRFFDQQLSYKDSIEVPQVYKDSIWDGLGAIYNLTTLPERDSVFDKYCIHHEVSLYVHQSIIVAVDPTWPWTQNWQNLNTTTGVQQIDDLLSDWGFTIDSYSPFSNYAVLSTTQYLNALSLCDSLETFGGVNYAEPNSLCCDGNKIFYNVIGTDRYYDFVVAYGDCFAGCICSHTFQFVVHDDCSVNFLGTTTSPCSYPIPPTVNCDITTNISEVETKSNTLIYPNPVSEWLSVKNLELSGYAFIVKDITGRIMDRIALNNNSQINVSNLSSGIYFLSIYNDQKSVSRIYKFVKKDH